MGVGRAARAGPVTGFARRRQPV